MNGHLYRGCLHLDVLKSTMPQSLEDWTHLVGIITTAPDLYHRLRNERSGISRSSGRLGQRSRGAHRQRLNLVQSCPQSRRVVLFPYPTTSHLATNIDGRGCALPGTSLNSQPDWLLHCNGILASSPKYLTEKLQSVLRVAARLVLRLPSRSPISASMRDQLHWLSIESRVKFKLALLAYKSVHSLAPEYLSVYCVPVSRLPGRSHLRSADQWTMFVPRTKTVTIGPRGFYCSSPSVWNSLPVSLRDFDLSLESFRRKLKLHLFIS